MKKVFLIVFFVLFFLTTIVFGQKEEKQGSTSAYKNVTEDVLNLKEKVASKVAELKKKDDQAYVGYLKEKKDDQLIIISQNKDRWQIKLDDVTTKYFKITGYSQKEIKREDLNIDDYLIVSGVLINNEVLANYVYLDQPYIVGQGRIIEVDKENYNLKIISSDKTVYNLSIETFTKQYLMNIKSLELEKIGFSKIINGDYLHFSAKIKGDEKENTFSPEKIIIIPQEYFLK